MSSFIPGRLNCKQSEARPWEHPLSPCVSSVGPAREGQLEVCQESGVSREENVLFVSHFMW